MADEKNISTVSLNLARKWRSRTFDQVVGQDICVRMLKNSLYLGCYFPVYLFSGHRGSGKTSMARIFASAVNCQALTDFKKNPKETSIPCLTCESCQAMQAGKHPDFIEIDAASHTGVDNVRQIIETSSLLPLMGTKKIYLIDEAHMLSKAAFNAFLKILEEPPQSAFFMLATTEVEKVIDTVRSRCFQLVFRPLQTDFIVKHLAYVCEQEKISIDVEALQTIAHASQGAVRDALNLLEQARFSSKKITKKTVLALLGHIDDTYVMQLFNILIHRNCADLIAFLQDALFLQANPQYIWTRLLFFLRAAIWLKQGVIVDELSNCSKQLLAIVNATSFVQLTELLDRFYEHELLFLRTSDQHTFIEMFFLKLVMKTGSSDSGSGHNGTNSIVLAPATVTVNHSEEESDDHNDTDDESKSLEPVLASGSGHTKEHYTLWKQFLNAIGKLRDPLVESLFKQVVFDSFETKTQIITVHLPQRLSFLRELLEQSESIWKPILQSIVTAHATIVVVSVQDVPIVQKKEALYIEDRVQHTVQEQKNIPTTNKIKVSKQVMTAKHLGKKIDIADKTLWPATHMLLQYFPGIVYEIPEENVSKIDTLVMKSFQTVSETENHISEQL